MSRVAHNFFDCNLGIAHRGMAKLLDEQGIDELKRGDVAVFVNKAMNAAKILYPGGTIVYARQPNNVPLSADMLRALPMRLPKTPLNFGTNWPKVVTAFDKRFGVGNGRTKVAARKRA